MKLNNAQDGIKQAYPNQLVMFGGSFYNVEAYTCSPEFWQALGKARGWIKNQDIVSAKKWFDNRYHNGDETAFWQSLP